MLLGRKEGAGGERQPLRTVAIHSLFLIKWCAIIAPERAVLTYLAAF